MFHWFQSAGRKRMVLPAVVAVLVVGGAVAFWLVAWPWLLQGFRENDSEAKGASTTRPRPSPPFADSGAVAEMGLQALLAQEGNPRADVDRLRADLLTFSRQYAGLPQARRATELLMRLPSPLDQLDRKKIPPEELAVAGGGDRGRAPPDLVAVLRVGTPAGRGAGTAKETPPRVRSLAFSGDGGILATGGNDRTVRIWDTSTGRELHASPPQGAPVNAVAFAAGNGLLASAAEDGTIKLWQGDTGKELQTVARGQGKSVSLAFHASGRVLAWGNDDGVLTIWDKDDPGQRFFRQISARPGPVVVAFSPGGWAVASGGTDGKVRLWDALSAVHFLITNPGLTSPITAVAWSPDRKLVAANSGVGMRLWQADSGRPVEGLKAQAAPGSCLAFRPDGRVLGVAGADGTIHLWDVTAEKEAGRIPLGPGAGVPRQLAFSPDGRYLAVVHDGGAVYILRLAAPPGKADGNQSGSPKEKK